MATAISSTSLPMSPPTSATWWSPKTILQILFVNFGLFFQSTCVVFTQLFSLFIYPFSFKKYRQFISYTMRMWSQNLVALVQWFAPANIVMTFDESCGSLDEIIKDGDITNLTFPKRIIVTANHQVLKISAFFFFSVLKHIYRFMLTGFIFGVLLIWQALTALLKLY